MIVNTRNGTWTISLHLGLMFGCSYHRWGAWVICLGPLYLDWMPNVTLD